MISLKILLIKVYSRLQFNKRKNLKIASSLHYIESDKTSYGVDSIYVETWNHDCKVIIGKYCSIGQNLKITLGGHNLDWISTYPFADVPTKTTVIGDRKGHPLMYGDVVIGNDVWIGSQVSIIGGIKIGDGAVVAASSHVVSDIQPYSIYGGNPAKFIRYRFDLQTIEILLELKWWEFSNEKVQDITNLLCAKPTNDTLKELLTFKNQTI